jgi:hypothetical protein
MNESGEKLDAAYRALAREEPRAAIDDAILAASRRAVAKPSAAHRWAAPVSIAAVLVLAFGVTLHMREESPGIESPDLDAASRRAAGTITAPEPAKPAPADRMLESPSAPKPTAPPAPVRAKKLDVQSKRERVEPRAMEELGGSLRDQAVAVPERKDIKTYSANIAEPSPHKEAIMQAPVSQSAPAPAARVAAPVSSAPPPTVPPAAGSSAAAAASAAPAVGALRLKREAAAVAQERAVAADAQIDELTRDLEAIAKLRAEGRNEEADKALEEFRRKHPGHRIPDAMWERVKPR